MEIAQTKDSDSDEQVIDPEQIKLWSKIDEVLKEYYLSPLALAACKKFIKDKVASPDDQTVSRLREWLLMKISGQPLPKVYHPRQLGCPDLVPGLTLRGFWDRASFDWVEKLEARAPIIRAELLKLRETTGF
jgi:hypothetical protein